MKLIMLIFAALVTVAAHAGEAMKVRVTGNGVSLRTEPSVNGLLLERFVRGDELVYLEKRNGWIGVQLPDSLEFWVSADYVEDEVVQAGSLTIRSGPNREATVVGRVQRGDSVEQLGASGSWLKIAPPDGMQGWISKDYVALIEPAATAPVAVAVPVMAPVPVPVVTPVPVATEIDGDDAETVAASEPMDTEASLVDSLRAKILLLDDTQPQGIDDEIPGILRRAGDGLYQLVQIQDGSEESICLVRGKEVEMERYLNRSLLMKGKKYWARDLELPIMQPEKIYL